MKDKVDNIAKLKELGKASKQQEKQTGQRDSSPIQSESHSLKFSVSKPPRELALTCWKLDA